MPWKIEGEGEAARVAVKDGKAVAVVKGREGDEEVLLDADEIMGKVRSLGSEAAEARKARKALEEKYAPLAALEVEGKPLDPEAVKKALDTLKMVDQGQLLQAGKAEEITKAAVAEANKIIEGLKREQETMRSEMERRQLSYELANSSFIRDRTTLTLPQALSYYGQFFKFIDGKPVGFRPNGERIKSKIKSWDEDAEPDEVIQILANEDPQKDRFLKPIEAGGSGATASSGANGRSRTMARSAFLAKSHLEQGKFLAGGGEVVD